MSVTASFLRAAVCIAASSASRARTANTRGLARPSRTMTANTPSCGPAAVLLPPLLLLLLGV
jgi:hypothetical protein